MQPRKHPTADFLRSENRKVVVFTTFSMLNGLWKILNCLENDSICFNLAVIDDLSCCDTENGLYADQVNAILGIPSTIIYLHSDIILVNPISNLLREYGLEVEVKISEDKRNFDQSSVLLDGFHLMNCGEVMLDTTPISNAEKDSSREEFSSKNMLLKKNQFEKLRPDMNCYVVYPELPANVQHNQITLFKQNHNSSILLIHASCLGNSNEM
ncbi:hypothetical protein HK096_010754 [Nowakowskiella sp. JEL0078]|nr:hypothetical protein HK096_010754 [Nowakowskiella sp. JEL0078]